VVAKGTEIVILDREGDWYKIATANNRVGWMHSQFVASRQEGAQGTQPQPGNVAPTRVAMYDPGLARSGVGTDGGWPGNAILRTAKGYQGRGIPYRYGGASTRGFDCSGFVMTVLAKHGVKLPHRAADQYNRGKTVPRGQEMPGDLVFFRNTSRRGISHVGIYAGDGEFIHSSSSANGIVISRLDTGYYGHRYAGARRVK
jgi:cell wall-associated NlpC family hydrolase